MNETFITPGQPDDRQARIQAILSGMGHQPMSHEQAMVQMRQGGQPRQTQQNPRDRVGAQARVQAILRRLGDQNLPDAPQRQLNFQNPHWGNNAFAMQLMDEEQARRGSGTWNEGGGGPPETDMDVMQAWQSGMPPSNPGGVNYAMPWRDEGFQQPPDRSAMQNSPLRQQLLRRQGQQGPQQSLYDRQNEMRQAMEY